MFVKHPVSFFLFLFSGLPIRVKVFTLIECKMLVVVFPISMACGLLVFIWAVTNVHTANHYSKPVMLLFHANFRTEKLYSMFEGEREKEFTGLKK